jgi:hypothetical protein
MTTALATGLAASAGAAVAVEVTTGAATTGAAAGFTSSAATAGKVINTQAKLSAAAAALTKPRLEKEIVFI